MDRLRALSERFKGIRDQTHFHIDRDAVIDTKVVWDDAGITGNELGWVLDSVFTILSEIHFHRTGERVEVPDYDGTDAANAIRAYKQVFPDAKIAV